MKEKKQQPSKKEKLLIKNRSMEEFLMNMEENQMLDDHGPVIIGKRDQKPRLPEVDGPIDRR